MDPHEALPPPPRLHTPAVRLLRDLGMFFLDLAIAIGALLVLSLACGAVWAAYRGAQIAIQAEKAIDPASLMRMLGQPGAIAMILMTLVSTGGAALLVYFWRRRATREEVAESRKAALSIGTWGWVAATGLATFGVSSAVGLLGQQLGIKPRPTNLALIEAAFVASPAFMLIFGIFIAPAYEELLFRRVLFGRLWAAGRPWLGVALSSVAFAFMHEMPGTTGNSWQATTMLWLTYGLMGAAFAFVYWRTRTLWAAVGAHALNNGIALTLLKWSAGG
jgi:CAAX protease family protein